MIRNLTMLIPALAFAAGLTFILAAPARAHPSIDIVASNWKFTPDTIELYVGQSTTLRLTSSQGVHGLQSDDLGIPQTTITPGSFSSVVVTPKKAGTYELHCAVMCGAGHANMKLTVHVLP
jgi:cytochrome c oxidase subunit II